jgi:hypothetical protein
MGARIILQMEIRSRLGIVFDDDGVHGISIYGAENYADGKPCYLLVSVDSPLIYPLPDLDFCTATIVVISPNLKPMFGLNAWRKQFGAYQFVAPPPSCPEVVYLLYVEFFNSHQFVY